MHLSPDQVAAAELAGCSFPPATPAQVRRLAMQRKIHHIAGREGPVLATRDGGFFETDGTLARLIEESRRQRHELTAKRETTAPATAELVMEPAEVPGPDEIPARAELLPTMPEPVRPHPAPVVPATPVQPAPTPVMRRPAAVPRAERWVTAGAERRGRAGVHWSTRRR